MHTCLRLANLWLVELSLVSLIFHVKHVNIHLNTLTFFVILVPDHYISFYIFYIFLIVAYHICYAFTPLNKHQALRSLVQKSYYRYKQGRRNKSGEKRKKRIDKDYKKLSDSYKKNALWSVSGTIATSRQCHYILFKHKSNVHNKEAILWSACFNVPLRQIKNSDLKVRNGNFDEPHRGKMIPHFTELKKDKHVFVATEVWFNQAHRA